jgi:hypothetical protein
VLCSDLPRLRMFIIELLPIGFWLIITCIA